MNRVFVIGGDASVRLMFHNNGWANVFSPNDADYLCFTGGADVSPEYYGEANTGQSHCDPSRDKREIDIFKTFIDKKKIGICRGGQFLNVMSGGRMIQDISFHSGYRKVSLPSPHLNMTCVTLHEDHHQGIVPGLGGHILGMDLEDNNVEIVHYYHTKSLCFQAHPEWGDSLTEKVFFDFINTCME